jgi:hypothetical protein
MDSSILKAKFENLCKEAVTRSGVECLAVPMVSRYMQWQESSHTSVFRVLIGMSVLIQGQKVMWPVVRTQRRRLGFQGYGYVRKSQEKQEQGEEVPPLDLRNARFV